VLEQYQQQTIDLIVQDLLIAEAAYVF